LPPVAVVDPKLVVAAVPAVLYTELICLLLLDHTHILLVQVALDLVDLLVDLVQMAHHQHLHFQVLILLVH
jgi:hypothetical protein